MLAPIFNLLLPQADQRVVGSYQKYQPLLAWPEPKSVLPERGHDLEFQREQPTLILSLLSGGRKFNPHQR